MKITPEIINLIKEGLSLNKIKEKTGFNKSSLYYHYKKIKGRKFKKISLQKNDQKIGEFMGIFAGDGNFFFDKKLYHYRIKISTGLYEKGYIKYLKKFLKNLFSKPPRMYKDYKNNVNITEYYSKEIYYLIKKYLEWHENKTKTIKLKNLENEDEEFLIGFLRGLFDTDGGIYIPKNKAAFGTSSQILAKQIKQILEKLELKPGFYKYKNKDFWYIDLYGSKTDKFMKIIKPNNPNKIIKRL